jgi:hypothetical protein
LIEGSDMRRILLAAATLAIAFPLLAADATAPKTTGAPVPLLWKVSDKDNTVYLLGSFHMLTEDDYPLSKDIDAAYADAEEVVFELPPEEMLSKDLGLAMTKAAIRTTARSSMTSCRPRSARAWRSGWPTTTPRSSRWACSRRCSRWSMRGTRACW